MMIGPSAPNGPPDPIEIADEIGFSSATFGSTRLPLIKIASIASGMPCPRILSDPYRAITPIISAPPIGTSTLKYPKMVPRRRHQRRAPPPEIKQIGEQPDQSQQHQRHNRRQPTNRQRQPRNRQQSHRRRKITELLPRSPMRPARHLVFVLLFNRCHVFFRFLLSTLCRAASRFPPTSLRDPTIDQSPAPTHAHSTATH